MNTNKTLENGRHYFHSIAVPPTRRLVFEKNFPGKRHTILEQEPVRLHDPVDAFDGDRRPVLLLAA